MLVEILVLGTFAFVMIFIGIFGYIVIKESEKTNKKHS